MNNFDVLIVYSGSIALSAGDKSYKGTSPFRKSSRRSNYNNAYAFFLKTCRKQGLKAALSTTSDITDSGTCSSYWTYKSGSWSKNRKSCYSTQIFDKFSPLKGSKRAQRKMLFSSKEVKPFNNTYLSSLFFDKFETYKNLPSFTIPTVEISGKSKQEIGKSIKELRAISKKQLSRGDYSKAIIVKDRFGAGGNHIYKITKNYLKEIHELINAKNVTYILQPYVKFTQGFSYKDYTTATDIRLIYHNNEIIQTYIRMAKEDDFRCNEHQGGKLLYVKLSDIPKKVIKYSQKISSKLQQNNSLYALDFIVSDNGNIFFLEGNIGPGLDWDLSRKKNELMSKKLIGSIVDEIGRRVERLQSKTTRYQLRKYPSQTNDYQIAPAIAT